MHGTAQALQSQHHLGMQPASRRSLTDSSNFQLAPESPEQGTAGSAWARATPTLPPSLGRPFSVKRHPKPGEITSKLTFARLSNQHTLILHLGLDAFQMLHFAAL